MCLGVIDLRCTKYAFRRVGLYMQSDTTITKAQNLTLTMRAEENGHTAACFRMANCTVLLWTAGQGNRLLCPAKRLALAAHLDEPLYATTRT